MNLFRGLITHVIDPSNFWMRFGTDSDMKDFAEYQHRLNGFYNEDKEKCVCSIDQLFPGCCVIVAQKPINGVDADMCNDYHWERAQVTRVNVSEETADVFFVDMGFTDIVGVATCRHIQKEIFSYMAHRASRVCLSGIKPLSMSWTSRASHLLHKLTFQEDVLALPIDYDCASDSYNVLIYTRMPSGRWQSLIHRMMNRELGVGTVDNIEEFLTEEEVTKSLQAMEQLQMVVQHDKESGVETAGMREANNRRMSEDVEDWDQGMGEDMVSSNGDLEGKFSPAAFSAGKSNQVPRDSAVTGFDYRALRLTRSVSVSKMQQEKDWQTQEQTKHRIEEGLQRLPSEPGNADDQDWDNVGDVDFHEITSQIHRGKYSRLHSDNGITQLLRDVEKLEGGPGRPPTKEEEQGRGQEEERKPEGEGDPSDPSDAQMKERGEKGADNPSGLGEIESYDLEKRIKKLLTNQEGKETDFVCASVFSIVEPDVDTPADLLQVVICAILEYVMEDSHGNSAMAFAILEVYSDAGSFVDAMVEVIQGLKQRLVRKSQVAYQMGRHREFSELLARVFQQAEDWETSVCKAVREYIVSVVDRWIIFNKHHHLSGEEFDRSEMVYLESAETFLHQCQDRVKAAGFGCRLGQMEGELRQKLVQDGTCSRVRSKLLDMFLMVHTGTPYRAAIAVDAACQTQDSPERDVHVHTLPPAADNIWDCQKVSGRDDEDHQPHSDKNNIPGPSSTMPNDLQPQPAMQTASPLPGTYASPKHDYQDDTDNVVSIRGRKELPKSIRNLPPRFIKKYLQEQNTEQDPSFSSSVHTMDTMAAKDSTSTFAAVPNTNTEAVEERTCSPHEQGISSPAPKTPPSTAAESFESFFSAISPQKLPPSPTQASANSPKEGNNINHIHTALEGSKTTTTDVTSSHKMIPPLDMPSPFENYIKGLKSHQIPCEESSVDNLSYSMDNISLLTPVNSSENSEGLTMTNSRSSPSEQSQIPANTDNYQINQEKYEKDNCFESCEVPYEGDVPQVADEIPLIRYTPQELKDLNPRRDLPRVEICDLLQPYEVLSNIELYKWLSSPGESHSRHRIKFVPVSTLNPTAEDFYPSWGPKPYPKDTFLGSSVDGDSKMCASSFHEDKEIEAPRVSILADSIADLSNDGIISEKIESKLSFMSEEERNQNSQSLQNIAMDLFQSPASTESNGNNGDPNEEMWHDDVVGPGGDFLKRNNDCTRGLTRKAKKKKGKGKPLDEFLREQEELKMTGELDSINEGEDLCSAEALEMYEELERKGVGMDASNLSEDIQVEGAEVLRPKKLSIHLNDSTKRTSLFAAERERQSGQPPRPWCPGRRFCSRCGSSDHTVYACPETTSRLLADQSF